MSHLPPGADISDTPLIPPPAGQTSNFNDPVSLAPVAQGMGGLLIVVETILLILRTCSNIKGFGKLRFEDCKGYGHRFLTEILKLTCPRLGRLGSNSDLLVLCYAHAPYAPGVDGFNPYNLNPR